MNNHHDEHESDGVWTFEESKLLENAKVEIEIIDSYNALLRIRI